MLTRISEYALGGLIYLTQNECDWPIPGWTNAEQADIPAKHRSKILGDLVKFGILRSSPGKTGRFRLSKPPTETMLRDVLSPFEQVEHLRCPFGNDECSDENPCLAHDRWKKVAEARDRFLHETSVNDVAVPVPSDCQERKRQA